MDGIKCSVNQTIEKTLTDGGRLVFCSVFFLLKQTHVLKSKYESKHESKQCLKHLLFTPLYPPVSCEVGGAEAAADGAESAAVR